MSVQERLMYSVASGVRRTPTSKPCGHLRRYRERPTVICTSSKSSDASDSGKAAVSNVSETIGMHARSI